NIKIVDSAGNVGSHSSIAVSGSNVYISYRDSTRTNLKFAKSTDGGATWSPANIKIVDSAGNVGSHSSIAVSGSNVYISYRDSTRTNLKFAKSTDGGATWSPANIKIVDSAGNVGSHSSIAAPDANNIFISYKNSTNGDLKFIKSNNGGATWVFYPSNGHEIASGSFSTPSCALFDYGLSNSGTSHVTKTSGNAFTQNTITKTLISSSMTEPVTLSLSGVPNGTSYSISNSICSPTCNSVITFTVSPSTSAGTYLITVTGSPLNKQTSFNLVVSGNPMTVTCSAFPRTALLGQTVTWTANVSGGTPPLTYSWSGTNFPTTPSPSTNPFSISYSTIGQKTATVTVTDVDSVTATCPAGVVRINFDPSLEEF
ncbi:MAG: hypothetical protein AAB586_01895, partial [Patescibacteria group bacterium]